MANQKERSGSTSLHIINVSVILLALIVVGVLALVLPKPTISEIEKRELAQKPQWSLSSWFSGSFAEEYEAYYADTFPEREKLVSIASKMETMKGIHPDDVRIHQANTPQASNTTPVSQPENADQQQTAQDGEQTAIDYDSYNDPNAPGNGLSGEGGGEQMGGLFLYQNMGMQIFGSSQNMSQRYAKAVNAYAESLDGVQVYSLIAPTSIEFYLPSKYNGIASSEREDIDFIMQNLSDKVKAVDAYSEIEKQKDDYIYFRTDHHWTVRGAYAAYIAFCKTAGLEPVSLDKMEHHQIDGFVGTFYNQTQDEKLAKTPDFVEYFMPPTETETFRYERGKPFDPVQSTIFAGYATGGQNTYSVFLHGDHPLTHIQTENHTGRKIMLIKESFGNAFAPFLISHYDEVFIVDQRYFELNLEEFIRENGITDLLILNNIFAANTGVRIQELETIRNQTYVPYVPPVIETPVTEPEKPETTEPEQTPAQPQPESEKQPEKQQEEQVKKTEEAPKKRKVIKKKSTSKSDD